GQQHDPVPECRMPHSERDRVGAGDKQPVVAVGVEQGYRLIAGAAASRIGHDTVDKPSGKLEPVESLAKAVITFPFLAGDPERDPRMSSALCDAQLEEAAAVIVHLHLEAIRGRARTEVPEAPVGPRVAGLRARPGLDEPWRRWVLIA